MYISAKQALESHRYNIQIQWYCWWVGNKNSHLTACEKNLFLSFQFSAEEGKGGMFSVTACTKFSCTEIQMPDALKTFLHMNILQSNCIATSSCTEAVFSFPWIRLNIQRIFFLFPEFELPWRKGPLRYSERRTTDGEKERKRARKEEVEKIDRDRVGKKEKSKCERQEQRYCWYTERQRELLFRSDEVQLWVVMCDTWRTESPL